jgi:hypothetical protein
MKVEVPTPSLSYALQNQAVVPVKTRKQISLEYGIGEKTLARKLKYHNIHLPPGVLTPKYQNLIYEALGEPPFQSSTST